MMVTGHFSAAIFFGCCVLGFRQTALPRTACPLTTSSAAREQSKRGSKEGGDQKDSLRATHRGYATSIMECTQRSGSRIAAQAKASFGRCFAGNFAIGWRSDGASF
jgi:hypothetical protein